MPRKRAAFKARFKELVAKHGKRPVAEWGIIRPGETHRGLVTWRSGRRRRALQLSEAHPHERGRLTYAFTRWGQGIVGADKEVDMLCVHVADAAAHAEEIFEIYRRWLVDALPEQRMEEYLDALLSGPR
jgi:hypothetical protein